MQVYCSSCSAITCPGPIALLWLLLGCPRLMGHHYQLYLAFYSTLTVVERRRGAKGSFNWVLPPLGNRILNHAQIWQEYLGQMTSKYQMRFGRTFRLYQCQEISVYLNFSCCSVMSRLSLISLFNFSFGFMISELVNNTPYCCTGSYEILTFWKIYEEMANQEKFNKKISCNS